MVYSWSHGICCLQSQVPQLNRCMKIGQHQLVKVKIQKLKVAAVKTVTDSSDSASARRNVGEN